MGKSIKKTGRRATHSNHPEKISFLNPSSENLAGNFYIFLHFLKVWLTKLLRIDIGKSFAFGVFRNQSQIIKRKE